MTIVIALAVMEAVTVNVMAPAILVIGDNPYLRIKFIKI